MAKQVLIEIKGTETVSKAASQSGEAITKLGNQTKTAMDKSKVSAESNVEALDSLGNRMRYLSMAFGLIAAGTISMAKGFVDAYRDMEMAMIRLGVMSESAGEDFGATKEAALTLADTGLVTVTEAANAMQNLLATGLGLERCTKLLQTFLSAAYAGKESLGDSFGAALVKASLGIRIFQERQADAVGINTQFNKVFKEYADTIGVKNVQMLTNAQKWMALYNFYMREGARYTGVLDFTSQTFTGTLSRLNNRLMMMKAAIGEALVPLVGTLAQMLTYATNGITKLAQAHSGWTSILITSAVVLPVVVASLAMLGAILPMIIKGVTYLSSIFSIFNAAALITMIKIAAIGIAIGGLAYIILNVTGQWKKWTDILKTLPARIKEAINEFTNFGNTSAEATAKVAKQVKKLNENIALATRDFTEDMGTWVKKHDETVKDLKKQIQDLTNEYAKSNSKIRDDFNKTMSDLSLSHSRKTEDLQREINEEVSKGIWADQTRIRELKLELKRENEDYALSSSENADRREEDLTDATNKYDERYVELKTKLDAELKLEADHAVALAYYRTYPLLDELNVRSRAFQERLQQYADELKEIQETAAAEADALNKTGKAADIPISKIQRLTNEFEAAKNKADALATNAGIAGLAVQTAAIKAKDAWLSVGEAIAGWTPPGGIMSIGEAIGSIGRDIKNFIGGTVPRFLGGLFFQEGGIIPGAPSQAVPIIAHGGETVLSYGMSPITVNINNPSVRSSQDIQSIADAVKQVLSREQVLKHYQ